MCMFFIFGVFNKLFGSKRFLRIVLGRQEYLPVADGVAVSRQRFSYSVVAGRYILRLNVPLQNKLGPLYNM